MLRWRLLLGLLTVCLGMGRVLRAKGGIERRGRRRGTGGRRRRQRGWQLLSIEGLNMLLRRRELGRMRMLRRQGHGLGLTGRRLRGMLSRQRMRCARRKVSGGGSRGRREESRVRAKRKSRRNGIVSLGSRRRGRRRRGSRVLRLPFFPVRTSAQIACRDKARRSRRRRSGGSARRLLGRGCRLMIGRKGATMGIGVDGVLKLLCKRWLALRCCCCLGGRANSENCGVMACTGLVKRVTDWAGRGVGGKVNSRGISFLALGTTVVGFSLGG